MKAIDNMQNLVEILNAEDTDWQKIIYNEIGVLLLVKKGQGFLLSNCGNIDLDYEEERYYLDGEDKTEYISIKSIRDIIDYILEMDSYQSFLQDASFGQFTKSDLFWAVQNQIILDVDNQRREDGSIHQDWRINRISKEYRSMPPYNEHKIEEVIVLSMDLVDYNEIEIEIPPRNDLELSDALKIVVDDMNQTTEYIEEVPTYRINYNNPVKVPKTFDDMIKAVPVIGWSWWL